VRPGRRRTTKILAVDQRRDTDIGPHVVAQGGCGAHARRASHLVDGEFGGLEQMPGVAQALLQQPAARGLPGLGLPRWPDRLARY